MLLTVVAVVGLLLVIPFVLMFGHAAQVRPPGRWFWVLAVVGVPVANVVALALTGGGSSVALIWGVPLGEFAVLVALLRAQGVTRLWTHAGGAILVAGGGSLLLTLVAVVVVVVTRYPQG